MDDKVSGTISKEASDELYENKPAAVKTGGDWSAKDKADHTQGQNTRTVLDKEMPMGLGFSLAANSEAMKNYSNMSDEQRMKIMEEGKHITAKEQMAQLIDRIADNSFQ